MVETAKQYEYFYADSAPNHHHVYLLPSLLQFISQSISSDRDKSHILDLGCGNGSLSLAIAKQGYQVVGVEESAQGIVNVGENNQNSGNCEFIQASIYDLPYQQLEHRFDVVISVEVIEHLLYPRELVRAAKKCLKSNGHLILSTPYHGYIKNLAIAVAGKMDRHFTALWDGGHVKFFSVDTLTQLLEAEGFTDVKFSFAGGLPWLWKSMLCSATPT
jgi:2-polyprenyl-3-methyl-5-hydroxy-6-metoxy-1,4-benzoquinol methylase